MKKIILLIGTLAMAVGSLVASAEGPSDRRVLRVAERTNRILHREIDFLRDHQKREIVRKYRDIQRIMGFGGDPTPRGFYCSAACKSVNGTPNLKFSRGAKGEFETQARQAAVEAVRSAFSCTYGIIVERCEENNGHETNTCGASCANVNGRVNLKFVKAGNGSSLLEAAVNARMAVQSSYSCTYGVVDYDCSAGHRPNYCTAACADVNGRPNLRYSKGMRGDNEVQAKINAIDAVRSEYSCTYGIVIDACEGR